MGARTRGFVFPRSFSTRSPRGPIFHREHIDLAKNKHRRRLLRRATTEKWPFSARDQSHGPIVKPSRTFDWQESKCFCREPHQRDAGQALQISCGFRLTVHQRRAMTDPASPASAIQYFYALEVTSSSLSMLRHLVHLGHDEQKN